MKRLAIAALAAVGLGSALAGAGPASAANITIDKAGTLQYTAAATEASHLRMYYDPWTLSYVFEDTGAASTTIGTQWCGASGAQVTRCRMGKFLSVTATLGDAGGWASDELGFMPATIRGGKLADTLIGGGSNVTLDGREGHDNLTAGAGTTKLQAGPGGASMTGGKGQSTYQGSPEADEVHARNGVAESITCGGGQDVVDADEADTVSTDCEAVTRGVYEAPAEEAAPETPADSQVPVETPVTAPVAPIEIATAPVALDHRGRVPVHVTCPAESASGCSAFVTLSLPPKARKSEVVAARRGKRVVGRSRRFKLEAGEKAVVPVTLARRSSRIFRHGRKTKLVATASVRTEAGEKKISRTITVKERRRPTPKRKGRKR